MAVEPGMVRLAARLPVTSDLDAIAAMLDRGPDGWEELGGGVRAPTVRRRSPPADRW